MTIDYLSERGFQRKINKKKLMDVAFGCNLAHTVRKAFHLDGEAIIYANGKSLYWWQRVLVLWCCARVLMIFEYPSRLCGQICQP